MVESAGDRVIPAALEEGQASWSHGFLVFIVEIKSAEGPLGQLVAMRRWETSEWGWGEAPAFSTPIGNPGNLLRVCLAYCSAASLKA
jgi:hypothetical protein